jgi:hypothetical protein
VKDILEFISTNNLPLTIEVGETEELAGTHAVYFKGNDSGTRFHGTWGKINIPKQNASFVKAITHMQVKKGTYEFFKEYNFQGQKATISPGDTWPTSDFRFRDIRSWRGI